MVVGINEWHMYMYHGMTVPTFSSWMHSKKGVILGNANLENSTFLLQYVLVISRVMLLIYKPDTRSARGGGGGGGAL